MKASRRHFVCGMGGMLAAATLPRTSHAQVPPTERAPILFLHGDGGSAAQWMTTLWRFESNFYPRNRLFAPDLRLPTARRVDAVREAGRSSSEEATAQVSQEVTRVRRATGVDRLLLVGQGRAGNLIRNHLRVAGPEGVRLAVLCGPPSHGAIVSDVHMVGSEYNGRTRFLRLLNAQPGGVTAGVQVVTLASDRNDLYAQPEGRFLGLPGVETGIGFDGPALRGATNLVLQGADHLETAFSPAAFVAIWRVVTGELPAVLDLRPEVRPVLNGKVTGWAGGVPTNIPVAGARVRVFTVDPATGMRTAAEVHARMTGADGAWGPLEVSGDAFLEFEISVRGHPVTHIYRSPFPRSSDVVHLRPHLPGRKDTAAAGGALVVLSRPRGFFDHAGDAIMLDGRRIDGNPDVPHESTLRLELPLGPQRSIVAQYNGERIAAATWPLAERRVTVIEMTG
jgi:pimeloyl-ACP methyl ester carboxylesterase